MKKVRKGIYSKPSADSVEVIIHRKITRPSTGDTRYIVTVVATGEEHSVSGAYITEL